MILNAPAKINLHLDVGPRRRDGYHTLDTIFQEISLNDTLRFSPHPKEIRLTITPKGLPTDSNNLIVRALEMLRAKMKVKKGIRVHLTKRIPMGAGLGGGSSDAAAALWAGWLTWYGKRRKPSRVPKVLLDCAPKLGADVAFFLRGGIAHGRGIGEKLTPMKSAGQRWLVLVYPRVHVSTPLAYRLLDEARKKSSPWNVLIQGPRSRSKMDPGLRHSRMTDYFNSFEPVILKKFPEIARTKQALVKVGCDDVMMSGSGSTVFGFVKSERDGRRVLSKLRGRRWQIFLVQTAF